MLWGLPFSKQHYCKVRRISTIQKSQRSNRMCFHPNWISFNRPDSRNFMKYSEKCLKSATMLEFLWNNCPRIQPKNIMKKLEIEQNQEQTTKLPTQITIMLMHLLLIPTSILHITTLLHLQLPIKTTLHQSIIILSIMKILKSLLRLKAQIIIR